MAQTAFVNAAGGFDGGLPRHALKGCKAAHLSGALDANGMNPNPEQTESCLTAALANDPPLASAQTRLDFHKDVLRAQGVFYPEDGTDLERVAMAFHAQREHLSPLPDGTLDPQKPFVVNGAPPVPGAPYNEPCVDDTGKPFYAGTAGNFFDGIGGTSFIGSPQPGRGADDPFVYKGANIQIDAVFNKVGYHYPQQRIIALWEDVLPVINKQKAPTPFVMRLNTFDCAKYLHSNLVPREFEVDDYQVRTPTDIIGQHIHLPKWDLTTADGAANGWNYEDGTITPATVRERIHAIEVAGGPHFAPLPHPELGRGSEGAESYEWMGARVTIQRWFADPIINVNNEDRGLGIIFTHDHYGPSTHQQIGLYSTLLIQPAGSQWYHNETGEPLGTRADGGPTAWQAAIEPGDAATGAAQFEPFREFYFEFSDFQHAYEAGVYVGAGPEGRPRSWLGALPAGHQDFHDELGINPFYPVTENTFRHAINPSFRQQAVDNGPGGAAPKAFPDIVRYPAFCPGGVSRPCPEAISADDVGMLVVNYRNEPVALRVFDPAAIGPSRR